MDTNRQRLLSAARRLLPSRADAEDAVQDTYIRALAAFPTVAEPQAAWLHTVLRNIAIDRLRRQHLESQHAELGSPPESLSESLMEARSECEAALRHLLEQVRPDEAAAILLSDVFEFDYDEIGRVVGKTAAASRQYVHRARTRARRSGGAGEFDQDYVALCWRAIEARDPGLLFEMLQITTACAQPATHAAKRPRGARTSTRLVHVNGRYALALVLDGVVLCIVPVGVQAIMNAES